MLHRIKNLIKIANQLDQKGLVKEADLIDSFLLKLAEHPDEELDSFMTEGPNPDDYLFYDTGEDEDQEEDQDDDQDDEARFESMEDEFLGKYDLEDALEAGPRG